MDLLASIDLYCERTNAAYWAEPVNALSNLAFLLAAYWGWITHKAKIAQHLPENGSQGREWWVELAILLAGLIGVGSYLFHTHANLWSELADVIPIWSFVAYYLFLAIYRIVGLSFWRSVRIFLISIGITALVLWGVSDVLISNPDATSGGDGFNGSTQYLPGLIALFGFALVLVIRRHPARGWILAAAATFCISLFFRSIDLAICGQLPLGTHFLWHCLNGLFIGLLLQALVRHGQRRSTPSDREVAS